MLGVLTPAGSSTPPGDTVTQAFLRTLFGALLIAASSVHAKAPPQDVLAPGDGAVLVTVSVNYPNAGNANAFANLIPALEVERLGGDKPEVMALQPALAGLQVARSYGGSLPPGRYRVATICPSCGDLSEPKAGEDLPEFTVLAGKTSYLGTVMVSVQGVGDKNSPLEAHWAWNAEPDARIGQRLLQALYPSLAQATTLTLDGWQGTPEQVLAAAERRLEIKRGSAGLLEPGAHGANGFHFGANNGVIKRWSQADGVQLIDTGSPFLIRSVVEGEPGQLLAGGEAGTVLYSADDGLSWTDVSGDLPYGLVLQLKSAGGKDVLLSLLHGENVSLYRGRLGESRWDRLAEHVLEFKFWTGLRGIYPDMHVVGRGVALTLPSKKALYLDLDSGESHEIDMPGSAGAFSFTADGVMRCSCARSIAVNPWESRDLGRTWTPSSLDRFMRLPVFRSPTEAFTYKGPWLNPKSARIFTTTDGGRRMEQSPHLPPIGAWVASQAYSADGSVMLLTGSAEVDKEWVETVFTSVDQGTTWQPWSSERTWRHAPTAAPADLPAVD